MALKITNPTFILNISNYSPSDRACRRSLACSATSLWKPQISPITSRFQPEFSSQRLFKTSSMSFHDAESLCSVSLMCIAKATKDIEAINHSGHIRIFGVVMFIDCPEVAERVNGSWQYSSETNYIVSCPVVSI
jgi:hypothetical protein